jgi:hypothetical protein
VVATPAARAAEIAGAITSISTTATHTVQWDQVDFQCTWAVPDGSHAGDTFTMQLPPELMWFGSASFTLAAPDGEAVATAVADNSGAVVFTLTDYVTSHPLDVHGACQFTTLYSVEGTGGPVTLSFHVGSQVIPVTIDTATCGADCVVDRSTASKASWWQDSAQTRVASVIRVPATTSSGSTVAIVDTPRPGLALDCSSLSARVGAALGADGYLTVPGDESTYPAAVSCTPQRAVAQWSRLPAGEYTELWVDATVVDPSLATYGNDGTVTVDGADTPVSDEVRRTDAQGTGVGVPTTPPVTTTSPTPTTSTAPPTTTVPTTTVPTTTVPTTTVPTTTVPTTTVPTTTVPTTTMPTTTVPTTTVPTTTVPTTTMPTTTMPTTTMPTQGTGVRTSPDSAPPAAARPASSPGAPALAFTGTNVGLALVCALGLLLAGLGIRASARGEHR